MITLLTLFFACHRDDEPAWSTVDRQPGERAPLTAACAAEEEISCLLPWPSSRLQALDPSRATGVRVQVEPGSLSIEDDPTLLNTADGFSRISAVAAGFEQRLDPATASSSLLLVVAEPGEDYGATIPLAVETVQGGGSLAPRDLLLGRPLRPMPAASEMVVIVLDELAAADGSALEAPRETRLALGLEEAASEEEARFQAYHAPTRALVDALEVDPEAVLRVWDFVTRSAADPAVRQETVHAADLAAFEAGQVGVEVDEVEIAPRASIAAVVTGRLTGLPAFIGEEGVFALDEAGVPAALDGTREARFRVVIPEGEGDYGVTLYGHGTAGNVLDESFDAECGAAGIAKVSSEWLGWTDATVFTTFGRLSSGTLGGAEISSAGLATSVANVRAVLLALDGALGDALAAETLGGLENPAAGRRPDTSEPFWMGGSLGGTMGAVLMLSEERVRYGVLNVAGGGWTHFIPASSSYAMLEGLFLSTYGDDAVDAALGLLSSQTAWDDADGAALAGLGDGDMALIQESIGDPVLPNIGTEILAASLGAALLDPYVEQVETLPVAGSVSGGMALAQFRVPESEGELGMHGFAARSTPAGDAAMGQIFAFFQSVLEGAPIIEPADCASAGQGGACDYSEAW